MIFTSEMLIHNAPRAARWTARQNWGVQIDDLLGEINNARLTDALLIKDCPSPFLVIDPKHLEAAVAKPDRHTAHTGKQVENHWRLRKRKGA